MISKDILCAFQKTHSIESLIPKQKKSPILSLLIISTRFPPGESCEMDSAKGANMKPPKGFINGMLKVRAL